MSSLSQFVGGGVTTGIVNSHSSGGTQTTGLSSAGNTSGTREILSGALTANALATLLTVTGSGRVPVLPAYAKNATSRTIRLVVEVDGVSVFDATSSAVVGSGAGIFAAGVGTSTNYFGPSEPIVFASSLVVKVASSLSETDNIAIAYQLYRT